MSQAETDSPDGEHGSGAEAEDQQEDDAPAYVETLEGLELASPLIIQAEGEAVMTSSRGGFRPEDSRNHNLTVEQQVDVSFEVPIKTSGDLEDAILEDNRSISTETNMEEAVQWSLEEMGREDLSPVDISDWDLEITGDVETYKQLAEMKGDLDLKNSRGGPGLTPAPQDNLEGLHKRGVFCDSLILAWVEILKESGQDYQQQVALLENQQMEDENDS